jgi:tRNA pseudouridine55 synthase
MDGLIVADKPVGPTSHDVVIRLRRLLRERRIGHTGTLDPMASGVLPLVLGRATRLARFLTADSKSYDATIRLGLETDTYDCDGEPVGTPYRGALPSREVIDATLHEFHGTFLQQPPRYSAKKIGGHRSYALARRERQAPPAAETPAMAVPLPEAVPVTAHALELLQVAGDQVRLRLDCSAGFYVRALAHDLGQRLGTGAHLVALRRTRSGDLTEACAVPLATLLASPDAARAALVPLTGMLPSMTGVRLTVEGARHAAQGRELGASDVASDPAHPDQPGAGRAAPLVRWVRLIGPGGDLLGIGEVIGRGLLHPSVILR